MKTVIVILCALFFVVNTTSAQKLGLSTTERSYDMSNGGKFEGLKHNGYSAEIIHIEYLSDGMAQVFISYAIYGEGDYKISLYRREDNKNKRMKDWAFGPYLKTGVIDFIVKQKERIDFVFEVNIYNDLPATFSEPFSLNTTKREAVIAE